MNVLKATGEQELFSDEKVMLSIQRAGIPKELEQQVLTHVKSKLYENIKTSEIYHHIIEFLGASSYPYAKTKYGLKQAIMDLGPTGYPFEDFIAHVLKAQGYETQVRQILQGKCISHEVDVIAKKGAEKAMIEAKFHNGAGIKTDVHVALYTKSRFDDVLEKNDLNQAWLVTNTKATQDAIVYGICMGMKVVSWNYPEEESLRDMIEDSKLHPITVLTSLSNNQKQKLLENHIVLCKDICKEPNILSLTGMSKIEVEKVLSEAQAVCSVS